MKTFKFGIVPVLSLFLFLACGEIEYVQPRGGTQGGEQPGGGDVNGQTPGGEVIEQTIQIPLMNFPLFYLDVEANEEGRMNVVGVTVPVLGDLRAAQEVPYFYPIKNDTTLTLNVDSILTELAGLQADILLLKATTQITQVDVTVIGLYNPGITGEVHDFWIKMIDDEGWLETGRRPGGSPLNYVLQSTYTATSSNPDPNVQGIMEIFERSMDVLLARNTAQYFVEADTNVDFGTKMRYFFTINAMVYFTFSMPFRE